MIRSKTVASCYNLLTFGYAEPLSSFINVIFPSRSLNSAKVLRNIIGVKFSWQNRENNTKILAIKCPSCLQMNWVKMNFIKQHLATLQKNRVTRNKFQRTNSLSLSDQVDSDFSFSETDEIIEQDDEDEGKKKRKKTFYKKPVRPKVDEKEIKARQKSINRKKYLINAMENFGMERKDAMENFVASNCCYGSSPAKEMEIRDITPSSSYHLRNNE